MQVHNPPLAIQVSRPGVPDRDEGVGSSGGPSPPGWVRGWLPTLTRSNAAAPLAGAGSKSAKVPPDAWEVTSPRPG